MAARPDLRLSQKAVDELALKCGLTVVRGTIPGHPEVPVSARRWVLTASGYLITNVEGLLEPALAEFVSAVHEMGARFEGISAEYREYKVKRFPPDYYARVKALHRQAQSRGWSLFGFPVDVPIVEYSRKFWLWDEDNNPLTPDSGLFASDIQEILDAH